MDEEGANLIISHLTEHEKRIINTIKEAGGRIFRTDLRKKIGGSNTTFIRKMISLRNKGIIEEFKDRDSERGRLKTVYAFSEYANKLFKIESHLIKDRWFSTSQKIILFPEFEGILHEGTDGDIDSLEVPTSSSQKVYLDTLYATNKKPAIEEPRIREALSSCNAFLQYIITKYFHPNDRRDTEGYILFRYRFNKSDKYINSLSSGIRNYVRFSDPIGQHKELSKIVELAIQHPQIIPSLVLGAVMIAHSMMWEEDLKRVLQKYKAYKMGEEPIQLARIELIISALTIFKRMKLQKQI